MASPALDKSIKILLLVALSVVVLYFGKPFLVPLLIAALLAMLLLPLCQRLERRMKRPWAVLICVLTLVITLAGIGFLIGTQVSQLSEKAPQIEKNIAEKIEGLKRFATETIGISPQRQEQMMQQQRQSSSGKLSSALSGLVLSVGGMLTSLLIVLVYVFLFLLFRDRFRTFVLKLVPSADRGNASAIIHDGRTVAQKYLTGLAIMIACLWVMYGIGFSLVGVENALFFAVLCGLLEIVPFVGNLTGVGITLLMALAQGGETNLYVGILIVYAVVQFTQTYLLEPLIVGREISINPVFTIVGLIAGELLWGIPGMVLALPLLGIVKIVCDRIAPLRPLGFLIGEEKQKDPGAMGKLKRLFKPKGS